MPCECCFCVYQRAAKQAEAEIAAAESRPSFRYNIDKITKVLMDAHNAGVRLNLKEACDLVMGRG